MNLRRQVIEPLPEPGAVRDSRRNPVELVTDRPEHHRRMVLELDGPAGEKVRQAGISIKLSETPGSVRSLGSMPGADTRDILLELGYSGSDIDKLREEGAIGTGY